jgi:hypothetical protein
MPTRRIVVSAALGVLLGALPLGVLHGQAVTKLPGLRPSFESFYTRIRFDGDGSSMAADGIGARLMWHVAPLTGSTSTLARRTELGVYGAYTPKRTIPSAMDASSYQLGLAGDLRPFVAPLGGRVDPFLSLGAGALFTHVPTASATPASPLFARSKATFAMTPAVGTRLFVLPNLALQGDVRDVMALDGGVRHNTALTAGVRLAF